MSRPARCTSMIESNGRRWRCERPAAKKHGGKFCGHCAPRPVKCQRTTRQIEVRDPSARYGVRFETVPSWTYHRAGCVGCDLPCCTDRTLCDPKLCVSPDQ